MTEPRPALSAAGEPLAVSLRRPWLVASFAERVRTCSWAIVGGGLTDARHVAWLEIRDAELRPPIDPKRLLEARLRAEGLADAVGLLTSRSVATYVDRRIDAHGVRGRCIATVGLGNALRAGDRPGVAGRIGTINVLAHVDTPLSDEALIEASAIATEAKCAAVIGAGIQSRESGLPATGTGTDCTVLTAPRAASGVRPSRYAGKHTAVGSVVGAAVELAVREGIARWLREAAR